MINGIKPLDRSLRWGMVGGGGTSQIGYIHRSAALRDGTFTLLAGAFDIDVSRGRSFGQSLEWQRTAVTRITARCFGKKPRDRTVLKPFPSPRQTTPTLLFAKRRWKRVCT